ncbi:histidine phosphatase family protein [Candidatus Kuenenbacteria bacterium]|nr:histidine phosphatase family protein [Candidatus Kuenenbacteria bacterium]
MKIYLIRHGETTGDIEDRYGGDYDDHLTEAGKQQSRELAEQLQGKGIEVIFVSPRIRARETAKEVEEVLKVPVEVVEDLRERNNYGVLSGLTKAEAKEQHPADFEKISEDKTYHDVTDSESYDEITKRATAVFENLLQRDHDTIAIISHGGIISTYVREVLSKGKNIKLGDCAILEMVKEGDDLSLSCLARAELR